VFQRILIANRGEIALRVIRTAREMGIECVAVFSEADRCALHTRMAHRAVALGGSVPADSYLVIDKIIDAALESGAEAIHPGYGFLAENAEMARRVQEAGLAWIGPPASAIETMGDKITSRQAMSEAGVPVVPGLLEPVADPASAAEHGKGIGFPIALKAAAGGGGKGIRIVRRPRELEGAFRTASGEAQAAFGDGRLYIERYLENTRHIEVQVLFDQHGNAVHLGERECSVQRRHQKLVEECPSPAVGTEKRAEIGEIALRAGRAVAYEGAGTIEFLCSTKPDGEREFFFLEMNTRLQVEHPVTEMVTGIDLVAEQLRVAAGERLGLTQEDVVFRGHAIEVRVNAEDPSNDFLPSTGKIRNIRLPAGPWVRIDAGLYRGMEVGLNYDPMLAKIITWAEDRPGAIRRMVRALEELNVGGVRTGAPAARRVLETDAFRAGEYDTSLLEGLDLTAGNDEGAAVAAVSAALHRWHLARRRALGPGTASREGWIRRGRSELGARWSTPAGPDREADA